MNTHSGTRRLARSIALLGAFAWGSAHADIYTWVDASGNVNLSNRPPPEGARVTNVFREDPAVHASAEAARAAAQREELRALNERVTQLERDLEAARRPEPAPVAYVPAAPPPAPYASVMAEAIVAPSAPAYGDCSSPWASCASPGYFGFYPASIVVLSTRGPRRFAPDHGMHRVAALPPAHLAKPFGNLPDPVNLFPGIPRR